MKPVTKVCNALINDDEVSINSEHSETSCDFSADIQTKSRSVEVCNCFVEVLLFTFVVFIFVIIFSIVLHQESFVYWARR